jgi:hypothetical protein
MISRRFRFACGLAWFSALLLGSSCITMANPPREPPGIERFVAIDNVCAWPNLTVLEDGTIIATIFNQPSHGKVEGDVECWASADGRFWTYRGTPAAHQPGTNRMNVAAGLANNGDLIVLAAGWTNQRQPGAKKKELFRDATLKAWVCRSKDGGYTWKHTTEFPDSPDGLAQLVPFGDIIAGADGQLRVSCYSGPEDYSNWTTRFFRSEDDGVSWRIQSVISPQHNETALFHLGDGRWLAAARLKGLEMFRSDDDGDRWEGPVRVTAESQHPGHLLRLQDGRILLSYGNRVENQRGAAVKLGSPDGTSWSDPWQLADSDGDCGYPSSVQRPDGKIVTAWYSSSSRNHRRYHMGVAIWELPEDIP